jgi:hypothetical protein
MPLQIRWKLIKRVLLLSATLSGIVWFTSPFWFGGVTPAQTAQILIQDRKSGMRALGMGNYWGDKIFNPLREASNNFNLLNNRNAFWVAELLAKNKSARSEELSLELYKRDALTLKLVGAIGLAGHSKLPKEAFQQDGELQKILVSEEYLYSPDSSGKKWYADTSLIELTLVAAKYAKSSDSVPDIIALIEKRPLSYWVHAYAARALGAIGDPRAILPLENAMRSSDFNALPEAFRALITLSSERAVPLAIERISPEIQGKNSGFLVKELEAVTGKSFGSDQARWKEWWATQDATAKPNRALP